MKFNINNNVRVKLTDKGRQILIDEHSSFMETLPEDKRYEILWEEDGWYTSQLWCLMEKFGPYIHIGKDGPFETEIEIEESKDKQ